MLYNFVQCVFGYLHDLQGPLGIVEQRNHFLVRYTHFGSL